MGHSYCNLPTANGNGTDSFCMVMSAGAQATGSGPNNAAFIASSSIRAVAGMYQEYVYLPGTKLIWEPRVSVTSTGNYWVGWLDNPELILNFLRSDLEGRTSIVQSVDTVKVYPIWQSSTTPIGPTRRKTYNVNVSPFLPTDESEIQRELEIMVFERSVQGAFIFLITGVPPGTVCAQPYIKEQISLRGLTGLPIGTT